LSIELSISAVCSTIGRARTTKVIRERDAHRVGDRRGFLREQAPTSPACSSLRKTPFGRPSNAATGLIAAFAISLPHNCGRMSYAALARKSQARDPVARLGRRAGAPQHRGPFANALNLARTDDQRRFGRRRDDE
jgi:hypothetical protein